MSEEIAILRRDLSSAMAEASQLKNALRISEAEVQRGRKATNALSSLSQELSTALNTIMGFSQLLKSRMREHDENLEKVLEAGSHMIDTIQQIIPLEDNGAAGALALNTSDKTRSNGAFCVLYVEDNLMNLRLIQQVFAQRPNFKLLSATRGKTALPLARQHQPGLILLDLSLPDMHGHEVLRSLRDDDITKNVPVVVISADSTPSQIERLLAAGARNYVTKPFNIARLLYTIDEIAADYARDRIADAPAFLGGRP